MTVENIRLIMEDILAYEPTGTRIVHTRALQRGERVEDDDDDDKGGRYTGNEVLPPGS